MSLLNFGKILSVTRKWREFLKIGRQVHATAATLSDGPSDNPPIDLVSKTTNDIEKRRQKRWWGPECEEKCVGSKKKKEPKKKKKKKKP